VKKVAYFLDSTRQHATHVGRCGLFCIAFAREACIKRRKVPRNTDANQAAVRQHALSRPWRGCEYASPPHIASNALNRVANAGTTFTEFADEMASKSTGLLNAAVRRWGLATCEKSRHPVFKCMNHCSCV
jgi:hypothetical protein